MSDLARRTHVSLFSGIGGLDLAAEWAGFDTILQVERDPYCLRVLRKHWPRVRRVRDVRWLKDIQRKVGTRAVDVLSGGFPCQPFSVAGKREGTADARHLWPRMLAVVECLRPTWVVAENVRGLLSWNGGVAFESVCADLEHADYEVLPLVYPVAGVGAPHLRYRVFVVGYSKCAERRTHIEPGGRSGKGSNGEGQETGRARKSSEDVPDSASDGRREGRSESAREPGRFDSSERDLCNSIGMGLAQRQGEPGDDGEKLTPSIGADWWAVEPDVRRVVNGVPARVDRLRGLGNAVSPIQAYPVFAAIARTEGV